MSRLLALVVAAVLVACPFVAAQTTTKPATTQAGSAEAPSNRSRVLIISVDGLRPDLALRCKMPNLRSLVESGSYSFWARTVPHAITLPSHVSMLTGVVPRKHKVEWNDDLPLSKPVYPAFPTLFGVAKKAGYTTALAAGKMKFGALCAPETVDWQFLPTQYECEDDEVALAATQMIRSHQPQVMAIHLPTVDSVGHAKGWGTREQVVAIEQADAHVGAILTALSDVSLRESTFIILTADHGGAGLTHLADDFRARYIPWIITGPGIRKGVDLTVYDKLVINTEDTFATACKLLNLPLDPRLDGKPVVPIPESPGELLRAEGTPLTP
ncbi:MAG: alkaline phosphatase family protein [Tepidisphaeraceae bacterium]